MLTFNDTDVEAHAGEKKSWTKPRGWPPPRDDPYILPFLPTKTSKCLLYGATLACSSPENEASKKSHECKTRTDIW